MEVIELSVPWNGLIITFNVKTVDRLDYLFKPRPFLKRPPETCWIKSNVLGFWVRFVDCVYLTPANFSLGLKSSPNSIGEIHGRNRGKKGSEGSA